MAYTSRYSEADKQGHGLEVAANWQVPFWLTDAAMATQNLLLLAEDAWSRRAVLRHLPQCPTCCSPTSACPTAVLPVGVVALGHRAVDGPPVGLVVG